MLRPLQQIFVILFVTLLMLSAKSMAENSSSTFCILTYPKGGSHLILKYFRMIDNYCPQNPSLIGIRSHMSQSHLRRVAKERNLKNLIGLSINDPTIKKIILLRDLRDVFCSNLDHIERYRNHMMSAVKFTRNWRSLPREKKIAQLIAYDGKKGCDIIWKCHKETLPQQLKTFIDRSKQFISLPNSIAVRFEYLSGPKAGFCTFDEMENEMQKINRFLKIDLDQGQLSFLKNGLWGTGYQKRGKWAFNKGKANRWKKEFNQELKELFHQYYGQDLIDLGYEKDDSWVYNDSSSEIDSIEAISNEDSELLVEGL